MGAILKKWQRGFELGDKFYNKVFAHKSVWALSVLTVLIGSFRETSIYVLNKQGFFLACPLCYIVTAVLFSFVSYFVAIVLFFYVYNLDKENLPFMDCIKKSLPVLRSPLFWLFVLVPLFSVRGFFSAFIIPVLAAPYVGVGRGLAKMWSLCKKFFMTTLGFAVYIFLEVIVILLLAGFVFWFLRMTKDPFWMMLGATIAGSAVLAIISFVVAMWTFLEVHIFRSDLLK